MSTTTFQSACAALGGPQYQSEASRQLDIGLSSVLRYASGKRPVPREVYESLSAAIDERLAELKGLRPRVNGRDAA